MNPPRFDQLPRVGFAPLPYPNGLQLVECQRCYAVVRNDPDEHPQAAHERWHAAVERHEHEPWEVASYSGS